MIFDYRSSGRDSICKLCFSGTKCRDILQVLGLNPVLTSWLHLFTQQKNIQKLSEFIEIPKQNVHSFNVSVLLGWLGFVNSQQIKSTSILSWLWIKKSFPEIHVSTFWRNEHGGIPCDIFLQTPIKDRPKNCLPTCPFWVQNPSATFEAALCSAVTELLDGNLNGKSLTLTCKKNHPGRSVFARYTIDIFDYAYDTCIHKYKGLFKNEPDSKIMFIYNAFPLFLLLREQWVTVRGRIERKCVDACGCCWFKLMTFCCHRKQIGTDWFLQEKQNVFLENACFLSLTAEQVLVENTFHNNCVQIIPFLLCYYNQYPTSLAKSTFLFTLGGFMAAKQRINDTSGRFICQRNVWFNWDMNLSKTF